MDPSKETAREDEQLLAYLKEFEARCPLCDYNLRNLTRPQCPECGEALELGVRLRERFNAAWITLVSALCAGTGPGIIFTLGTLAHGLPLGGPVMWQDIAGLSAAFYLVATVPGAILAFVLRKRFLRLRREKQWTIAFVVASLTCLAYLLGAILVLFG